MGIKVVDLAFGGLSDYYEFKTKEMDSLTGAVINIGHYKTEVSIIKEGKLKNVEVLEIGGRNIDRDISYIYDLNLETSKNLKENFSLAHKENASTSEIIECITKNEEKLNKSI